MSIPSPGTGGSRAGSSTTIFVEIFVQEVLIDPSDYKFPDPDDPETIPENYKLLTKGITEEELTKAPYNSIVGRIVSANEEGIEVIAYPMMQGHMMLPVKAGEHVWGMINNGRYYWLCRKNFDSQVDDVERQRDCFSGDHGRRRGQRCERQRATRGDGCR